MGWGASSSGPQGPLDSGASHNPCSRDLLVLAPPCSPSPPVWHQTLSVLPPTLKGASLHTPALAPSAVVTEGKKGKCWVGLAFCWQGWGTLRFLLAQPPLSEFPEDIRPVLLCSLTLAVAPASAPELPAWGSWEETALALLPWKIWDGAWPPGGHRAQPLGDGTREDQKHIPGGEEVALWPINGYCVWRSIWAEWSREVMSVGWERHWGLSSLEFGAAFKGTDGPRRTV